jgi:L-ribulokinase
VPQVAVGDAFNWFTEQVNESHEYLTEKAEKLSPGANGLVALDWWNGGRKPEVVGDLSGAVIGYTLQTTPEDVYRSLIESTAFGARYVVDAFSNAGIPVYGLRAGGGLTSNRMLLQIYSDVTGLEIDVSAVQNSSVFGAALLGAVASGMYDSVMTASAAMVPAPILKVKPVVKNKHVYDALYTQYLGLIKIFGHNESPLLKLREINRKSFRQ